MSARGAGPGCNALEDPVEAPDAVSERLGRLQQLSHAAICTAGPNGLTAIETAAVTGFDRYSVQPRISELRRKGLVVASGKRRRNPSGKTATVWIARQHTIPAVLASGF